MPAMRFQVDGKTAFAATGTAEHRPGRAAVVFIHGAGMDHSVWVMPARYFARTSLNVLAPDLPGHGRSEGPALHSIEDMANWVVCAMDATGLDEAAVVGHSMGALVAHVLAARFPERCRALALLGISAPMPVTSALLDAAEDNDHAAIDMANTWSHSPAARLGANENPGLWMLGTGQRLLETAGPGVFHADLGACNAFNPDEIAEPARCPTLVILGEADQMTPAPAGLRMRERLTEVRTVQLPGCGHSMLPERPNAVLDALISIVP